LLAFRMWMAGSLRSSHNKYKLYIIWMDHQLLNYIGFRNSILFLFYFKLQILFYFYFIFKLQILFIFILFIQVGLGIVLICLLQKFKLLASPGSNPNKTTNTSLFFSNIFSK
jgi:hypothetical protein